MPLLLPSTYGTVISCIFVYKWHKIAMELYALCVCIGNNCAATSINFHERNRYGIVIFKGNISNLI